MMKRNLTLTAGTLMSALLAANLRAQAPAAAAPEAFKSSVEVGVDAATSYVFRGATIDKNPVLQPAISAEILEGLTLGVWGNLALDDDKVEGIEAGEFNEVDLSVAYTLPTGKCPLGIGLVYNEYLYPNTVDSVGPTNASQVVALDYDREIGVNFELQTNCALDNALSPTLGVFYGVDGGIDSNLYVELGLGHTFEKVAEGVDIELGGTLGYANPDNGEDKDGLSFASVSAGLNVGVLSLGVSYYFETDKDVQPIGEDVVGTLGLSKTF